MKIAYYENSNKTSLVGSILILIIGIILYTNPDEILKWGSYLLFLIFAFSSFSNLIKYTSLKKKMINNKLLLSSSIVLLFFAFGSLFLSSIIDFGFRICIGAFVIYSGINRLILAISKRNDLLEFFINLGISALSLMFGFYILFNTNIAFKLIGIFIIVYSIFDIIAFIALNSIKNKDII